MSNGNNTVSADDVLKLTRVMEGVMHQMRAQRDILRQRGQDLPPGTLQGIESIHKELQNIAPRVSEQGYELDQLRNMAAHYRRDQFQPELGRSTGFYYENCA